ncbi:MAG: hypothetical protein PHC34_13880, partial [Candidatus Gastranaerophilales bacterium]|nr:hypothetical protein [Candidatus Gastranaerophilales bacterium]
ILISLFCMGISIASKIDFAAFLLILFAITTYFKPLSKKYIPISILSLLIVPVISWSILIFQGLTIPEIINYIQLMHKYLTSNLFIYFHKTSTGLFFTKSFFIQNITSFIRTFSNFILPAGILYIFLSVVFNKFSHVIRFRFPKLVQIALIIAIPIFFPFKFIIGNTQDSSLSWLSFSTTIILAILLFDYFKVKTKSERSLKDIIFIVIASAGIIGTCRSYFYISLYTFGTFLLPLAVLTNVVFLIDYLPKYFKFLDKQVWKSTCLVILILTGLIFFIKFQYAARHDFTYPVKSHRGTIYTTKEIGFTLDKLITYVKETIPAKSSFLMIPEGPMINFLTDRASDDVYYNLTPNFIEVFGEDNIIENLKKNPPDYIMINNRHAMEIGISFFGEEFGFGIHNFILQNYRLEKNFDYDFKIKVYKRL